MKKLEGGNGFTLACSSSKISEFLFYGDYDHRVEFTNGIKFPAYGIYTIKQDCVNEYAQAEYRQEFKSREDFISSYPSAKKGEAVLKLYGVK